MNKRAVGAAWEQRAAEYLTARGMRIVARNFRCRQGEIDLIGYHGGYLVFTEVKYRTDAGKGYASEAVDARKQRQICRVSDFYRYTRGIGANIAVRYDVVAVQGEEIEWLQNAFPYG
ncbi:MAG: YraN family protein [Roseburia sp.]|nr:YraN family protein [Roseburia sp.]MCM1099360.1 YraN family protein [Ruminococcus flavefaciens]